MALLRLALGNPMARIDNRLWLAPVMAAFLLGCEREVPPAMAPAATLPPLSPGNASVVFVRPTSPCDTSDYSIIVDERGRFVGSTSPGSRAAVSVAPGTHVFYSWSNSDLRIDGLPEFNPVAAVRVSASAEAPSYIGLIVRERQSTVTRCDRYAVVDMFSVRPGRRFWDELPEWLSSTKPLVADYREGQALLNANPAMLQSDLELGRAKLALLDDLWARQSRQDAERAYGGQ
jgi:hypothetical protein